MTDCVHLYVFDCQNFVSEKDYRAVLEQRRGFENAALDNETAAKKAKEQLAACRREFFEYRKVAWENEEIGHKALDDLQRAREAGRREGDHKRDAAYTAYFRLKRLLYFLDRLGGLGLDVHDYIRLELSQTEADYQKALIDSPKAEGEKPPKMLYVAFDCLGNPYAVSTRPEHIACDPARIKPYVPVEAEGEEPDGK